MKQDLYPIQQPSSCPRVLVTLALFLFCSLALAVEPSGGVEVQTRGRANVRYGPSLEARVITTLDPGARVQVYEATEGRVGWYTIAFPRAGHAWVHDSLVEATDDPNWLRVIRDGANVRSDSRINADLVTQLAYGERVEAKGRQVGNWIAIHPGAARAYIYHSVLDMNPDLENALAQYSVRNDRYEQLWQRSKLRYDHYREIFARDRAQALSLDWQGLDQDLGQIAAGHPTMRTKLLAQRIQGNIARVVEAASRYQRENRLQPLPDPDFTPARTVQAEAPVGQQTSTESKPTASVSTPGEAPQPSDAAFAGIETAQLEALEEAPEQAQAARETPSDSPASEVGLVGWIEQRDDPGLGTSYALIDAQGEIAAFVSADEGVSFTLSDFFWRRVRVQGRQTSASISLAGVDQEVSIIHAQSIRLED